MPEREQIQRSNGERSTDEVAHDAPQGSERAAQVKADLDSLLEEIDEVLEDNAEEFVRNYVQKGGQ